MGIFLRQSHNIKPVRWGSPADVQYSIWCNLENIYGCDHKEEALIMPMFWGFPLLDYSKYGNHGTNHGATYKDGSLDFDGGDDWINVPDDNSLDFGTDNFTIAVWFKSTGDTGVHQVILAKQLYTGTSPAGEYEWMFYILRQTSTPLAFARNNEYLKHGGNYENDNIWHLGVVTRVGDDGYLYANGQQVNYASGFFIGYSFSNNLDLYIGKRDIDGRYFSGPIAEVRIAKAARTPDQIGLFYENPYGLYRRVAKPLWSIPSGLTLTITSIDSAGLLDSVHLTQKHNLTVQALSGAGSLDKITLTQKHLLVLQELLSSGALDNVALIQKHILSVQELAGAGTLENVELTQKHILALQDLSSSGTLDNIVLELSTLLVVAGLISDGLLDNISLTQKHNLVVQELLSSGELDNITLSVSTLLIVAEMISSGALDGVNLTQKHNLAVQELISSGALDDLALTQKHLLVVQELLSAGAIDNIELLVATLLTVSDMLSTGAIDNTALTQKHILSIKEVVSAGQIDGLALTQKHLLIIDSLISSGIIDNIRFDIAAGLIYISLSDATEYNISLSDATEYNISLSDAGGGMQ